MGGDPGRGKSRKRDAMGELVQVCTVDSKNRSLRCRDLTCEVIGRLLLLRKQQEVRLRWKRFEPGACLLQAGSRGRSNDELAVQYIQATRACYSRTRVEATVHRCYRMGIGRLIITGAFS